MTDKEIELEQALIAVFGAYRKLGGDAEILSKEAQALIIGNSEYRITEHPHVTNACVEVDKASKFQK